MNIRKLALAGAVLILAACSNSTPSETAVHEKAPVDVTQVSEAKTAAVLIYADWCGSCKVLDPKLKSVQAQTVIDDLAFVTLDYTDKNQDAFFDTASSFGLETPIRDFLDGSVKTGQLLLIDMDDGEVIGRVTKDMSEEDIITALKTAVAAS